MCCPRLVAFLPWEPLHPHSQQHTPQTALTASFPAHPAHHIFAEVYKERYGTQRRTYYYTDPLVVCNLSRLRGYRHHSVALAPRSSPITRWMIAVVIPRIVRFLRCSVSGFPFRFFIMYGILLIPRASSFFSLTAAAAEIKER